MISRAFVRSEGTRRPQLRLVPPRHDGSPLRPVALLYSDGSIRPAGAEAPGPDGERWRSGSIHGEGWVLWWELRRF